MFAFAVHFLLSPGPLKGSDVNTHVWCSPVLQRIVTILAPPPSLPPLSFPTVALASAARFFFLGDRTRGPFKRQANCKKVLFSKEKDVFYTKYKVNFSTKTEKKKKAMWQP